VTFNIDPADAEARVTLRTKAIIPVHLFGQCADMAAIGEIARRHHLLLVEDAAQAIGAEFAGRRAGSLGDIGCFSFYRRKTWGASAMAACSPPRTRRWPKNSVCYAGTGCNLATTTRPSA